MAQCIPKHGVQCAIYWDGAYEPKGGPMYWFCIVLYAVQPWTLLLGVFGVFGKEGEKAAEDYAMAMITALIVLVVIAAIVGIIYLVLKMLGVTV